MSPTPVASDSIASPGADSNRLAAGTPLVRLRPVLLVGLFLSLVVFVVGVARAVVDSTLSTQSVVIGTIGFISFLFVCAVGGYADDWDWTGVGPSIHKKTEDEDFESGKTLWDALQLFIIPLALAVLGLWFTAHQNEADLRIAAAQRGTDLQIAANQQKDGVLDTYLDHMSDLVLTKGLRPPQPNPWAREIARARTATALRRLDSKRNAFLLHFLKDSKLMPFIDLSDTDLGGVQLTSASIPGIHLIRTGLAGASLQQAHLEGARLENANLNRAHLDGAFLSGANLSGGDTSLRYATLINADLHDAMMHDADLTGANLTSANLTNAKLSSSPQAAQGTLLTGANLFKATLLGTQLDGVYLEHANLRGAAMPGATLTGATLTYADLRAAKDTKGLSIAGVYWDHTFCPDGTNSATNHTHPQSCRGHGF
jgi:uncharacterized protein YjbI with pentapeptide repeats